jgi:hypothetical protein
MWRTREHVGSVCILRVAHAMPFYIQKHPSTMLLEVSSCPLPGSTVRVTDDDLVLR